MIYFLFHESEAKRRISVNNKDIIVQMNLKTQCFFVNQTVVNGFFMFAYHNFFVIDIIFL